MEISYFNQANERTPLGSVFIALAERELSELSNALAHMLKAPERGPDSHYHLTAEDRQEITIWVTPTNS